MWRCLPLSLHCRPLPPVPAETARVARCAFRRGNPYLRLRDALGPIFDDADFLPCYGHAGHPAFSPAQLALVTLLQYAENLTDEQTAEAVGSRLDWKYLLGLDLEAEGFDPSVLSEFRTRLVTAKQDDLLFARLLAALREAGVVRARGRQRTDSTHVLGAIARLNRLELVGETMRHTLNVLATIDPAWLRAHCDAAWPERYGPRLVARRLPRKETERTALMLQVGRDGWTLLTAIEAPTTPEAIRDCATVATLRAVWAQQYSQDDDGPRPRPIKDLPPAAELIASPYDEDARTSQKRDTFWTGYKAHLTETCDEGLPRIITHVETTPATTPDCLLVEPIERDLVGKELAPAVHLMDAGYATAAARVASEEQGIAIVAPVAPDSTWQARAQDGYRQQDFTIDWEQEGATCPQGKQSSIWRSVSRGDASVIQVHFRAADCGPCPVRSACTRADRRSLTLLPRPQYEAHERARTAQGTEDFVHAYATRAGIEGTISRAVRRCDLRRARYRGHAKTRLQHHLIAAALNLIRTADWLAWPASRPPRQSPFLRVMGAAT